jgi:hypothetical protein
MNSYYGRHNAREDDSDPGRVATVDQQHAMFRDFLHHLRDHCREALAQGYGAQDVAVAMARDLEGSDHTRETFVCLLAIGLTELAQRP